MKYRMLISLAFCLLAFLQADPVVAGYVGSERCASCHPARFNEWVLSGHRYNFRTSTVARLAPIPLPKGYTWDEISYVIGGHRWRAHYIDKNGHIITSDKYGKASPTQWNIASGRWVTYRAGEKVPFDCASCHTTGFEKNGRQSDMEGISGRWVYEAVQCEECHGPGGDHAANGNRSAIRIERTIGLCGKCHVRGPREKILAKDGFVEHHEQYNEYLASPHAGEIKCIDCHNPHLPARFGIKNGCENCHPGQAEEFKGSRMQLMKVKCIDCHMPKIVRSAEAVSKWEGDIRSHTWKIATSPDAKMFTEDGRLATGLVTLDFVCLRCHQDRTVEWAASKVKGIHSLGNK